MKHEAKVAINTTFTYLSKKKKKKVQMYGISLYTNEPPPPHWAPYTPHTDNGSFVVLWKCLTSKAFQLDMAI